jgi:hypothetical protein
MSRASPYAALAGVLEISPVKSLYEKVDDVKLFASEAGEAKAVAKSAAAVKKRLAIVTRAKNVQGLCQE